jgi:hypothetical protein
MFILFFFGLVVFQSAVNEELGLRELCPAQHASAGACIMVVALQSQDNQRWCMSRLAVEAIFLHHFLCCSERSSACTSKGQQLALSMLLCLTLYCSYQPGLPTTVHPAVALYVLLAQPLEARTRMPRWEGTTPMQSAWRW